jgi:hypothetical protein
MAYLVPVEEVPQNPDDGVYECSSPSEKGQMKLSLLFSDHAAVLIAATGVFYLGH